MTTPDTITDTVTVTDRVTAPGAPGASAARTFGDHLRLWRRIRGLSQLELSLRAEVSARHVSFLESGRARPSRRMVETLADALDVPLRARNPLILAAGFAPVYRETALAAPDAAHIRHVLEVILRGTDPFPALVLDRSWRVLMANAAGGRLLALCGVPEGLDEGAAGEGPSLFHILLAPGPLRAAIVNWDEVVAQTLRRLRREAAHDGDRRALDAALALLPPDWSPPRGPAEADESAHPPLLIPLHLNLGGQDLRFASVIATLGTAADIGLAELSIETFLPADAGTEALLRAQAD